MLISGGAWIFVQVQIKAPAAAESLALHRQMNPCEVLVGWYVPRSFTWVLGLVVVVVGPGVSLPLRVSPPPILSPSSHARVHGPRVPVHRACHRYSTSTDDSYITDATCAVHEYYMRENQRAVLLVVNTSLSASSVPIKAFVSTPSQLLVRWVALHPIPFVRTHFAATPYDVLWGCIAGVWCLPARTVQG